MPAVTLKTRGVAAHQEIALVSAEQGLLALAPPLLDEPAAWRTSALALAVLEDGWDACDMATLLAQLDEDPSREGRRELHHAMVTLGREVAREVRLAGARAGTRSAACGLAVLGLGARCGAAMSVGDLPTWLLRTSQPGLHRLTPAHPAEAEGSPVHLGGTAVDADAVVLELVAGDRVLLATAPPVLAHVPANLALDALAELLLTTLPSPGPAALLLAEPPLPEQEHARGAADALSISPLFRDLPLHALLRVARRTERRVLAPGQQLYAQGELGGSMSVVVRGSLDVLRDEVRLHRAGPGETLGELALVDSHPRSATVVASEESEVAELRRDDLLDLERREPQVAGTVLWALLQSVGDRLRSTSDALARQVGTPPEVP